jgi:hypothetical protein
LRLVAGGWFVLREKYCWLVADKPSERAVGFLVKEEMAARDHDSASGIAIAERSCT